MHKIIFRVENAEDVSIFGVDGENLLSLARKANVAIDAPCSGNGSCGKCRVKLLEGAAGCSRSRHISDADFSDGWRLACDSSVVGDAVLLVPQTASAYKNSLKVVDLSSPAEMEMFRMLWQNLTEAGFACDCGIRTAALKLEPPTLGDAMPDHERVCRAAAQALGVAEASLPYPVLKTAPELLRESSFTVSCVALVSGDKAEILDLCPNSGKFQACGLAIDIGTTTVTGLLVDLETGDVLAKANAGNGQIRYGADVINRIVEQQKQGGRSRLQQAVAAETLTPLIDGMCAGAGVPRGRIYRMAIASNTTMNHLLLGVNANFLRMEPYIPAFFELPQFDPAAIGIALSPAAKVELAPNIGSYVGGDITAGTLACMMWDDPEMTIFVDLGTNGEIVFGNNDFLMACACSAGPAFEGGDISCGMRAADGAIEACVIDDGTMEPSFSVIGGTKPVGLCGSGLIDVVAELFRTKIINGKGKFIRSGERVRIDEYGMGGYVLAFAGDTGTFRDIMVNEVDIDNFIRAKAAIFSAIMSLIKPLGFTPEDIGRVMVAGGIGSGINIGNAVRIGMLPALPAEKYSYIGNSALSGAYAMLVSSGAAEQTRGIAKNMTYIELSAQPGYMDEFLAACFLPHTDERLFQPQDPDSAPPKIG